MYHLLIFKVVDCACEQAPHIFFHLTYDAMPTSSPLRFESVSGFALCIQSQAVAREQALYTRFFFRFTSPCPLPLRFASSQCRASPYAPSQRQPSVSKLPMSVFVYERMAHAYLKLLACCIMSSDA